MTSKAVWQTILAIPATLLTVLFMHQLFDAADILHWLGYKGVVCQIADDILICILMIVIVFVLWKKRIKVDYAKIKAKEPKEKSNWFIMRCFSWIGKWGGIIWMSFCLLSVLFVMGFLCYDAYNMAPDLIQPPITEKVVLEGIHSYTSHSGRSTYYHTDVMFRHANGKQFKISIPTSKWFQKYGCIPQVNQRIPYAREAILTYYPNSKTVESITIGKIIKVSKPNNGTGAGSQVKPLYN